MKTIEDIYTEYKIMPTLREHMYRVAGVAHLICDHFKLPIDKKSVIETCLLHDMGNILKFDLDIFPEFLQPEGKEYWQKVKDEVAKKYNTKDQHRATMEIAIEVDANLHTLELLHCGGFRNGVNVDNAPEWEKKICLYADMRVSPVGVVGLEERLQDMEKRYGHKPDAVHGRNRDDIYNALWNIEQDIFKNTDINPQFITKEKVAEYFSMLSSISIH